MIVNLIEIDIIDKILKLIFINEILINNLFQIAKNAFDVIGGIKFVLGSISNGAGTMV